MMIELHSYLKGEWVRGRGDVHAAALVNPASEDVLANVSTDGIDFKSALTYARDRGGASLRRMTFASRGELLRAMSRAIHAHRDELITTAIANGGNTRSDAKFDIDGASGTLAAYADIGVELGDTNVIADGESVQLGRGARLFGAHMFVPRDGVAVHINAFNFPAWGLAEKAAVALLAGVPVISKPATSTALVAEQIVRIFTNEKLIPDGAFSFIAGGTGDLLGMLTGQDILAFTGSSTTAASLRGGKAILTNSVRTNVEADSLNSAVLGPDVEAGSDVMNLFINDVVRDMTQKTGQKCTAIRRVYVPSAMLDDVIGRISERLAAIRVGDPARDDVAMGPVATAQQLKDVSEGIVRATTECATVVCGGPKRIDGIGCGAAASGKGYFIEPTLLVNKSPSATDPIHTHEVFGPVATVMPYDGSSAHAAALVRAGDGGLVASVYSDDKEFLKSLIVAVAPYHGRITIGSSKVASQAIPPGTVLPSMVHGGPGRAGGGEELGGRRGLAFYMQRVAIQGDRALLVTVRGG